MPRLTPQWYIFCFHGVESNIRERISAAIVSQARGEKSAKVGPTSRISVIMVSASSGKLTVIRAIKFQATA